MATEPRWVLAFDASCEACRQLSAVINKSCGGRIELLPLNHPEVKEWREQQADAGVKWVPTVIKIQDGKVCTWTGISMVLPLIRRLGIRFTVRVLCALGELQQNLAVQMATSGNFGRLSWLRFPQLMAVGAIVAWRIIAFGTSAKLAAQARQKVQAWIAANKHQLPQTYDELTRHSLEYRKAIYSQLAPNVRSRLWIEHFQRYRSSHPNLTAAEVQILDHATQVASDQANFATNNSGGQIDRSPLNSLTKSAVAILGLDEARALIGMLGPPLALWTYCPDCTCNTGSDYCPPEASCLYYFAGGYEICVPTSETGCGTLWAYSCNGLCHGTGYPFPPRCY